MRKTLCALYALIGAFALAGGSFAHADDAVSLLRTNKEGDTGRYKTTVKVATENGMNVVVITTDKYQIKTVKPSGDVVILVTPEGGTLDLGNGQPQNTPAGSPRTETIDKSGKLTDFKVDMPDEQFETLGVQQLMETIQNIILSDKPVKPDDTWQTEMDDPAAKGKKITIKDTYLGTEKREGATLWKIKQSVEAPVGDGSDKLTAEVTALLDPKTGTEVYEEGKYKGVPTGYGALNFTTETVLLKPDSDTKPAAADSKKPSP